MNRILYFDSGDLFSGINYSRIDSIQIPSLDSVSINDAIEFYNIYLIFNRDLKSEVWSNDKISEYRKKSKKLYSVCKRFFNNICDDNLLEEYSKIDSYYIDSFWDIFNICLDNINISDEVFNRLIHGDRIPPDKVFSSKKIVQKYGIILRSFILEYDCCIKIIIGIYEQNYSKREKLYLPKEFTQKDLCLCLSKYIDGKHVNLNILDTISQINEIDDRIVPDEIKLQAKRRIKTEIESNTSNLIKVDNRVYVEFSSDIKERAQIEFKNGFLHLTYNSNLILNNSGYKNIFDNFTTMFGFFDEPQKRCDFISYSNNIGSFERIIMKKRSNLYPESQSFKNRELKAYAQMSSYYDFLKSNNIYLEETLYWFFTEYLQNQYNMPEIRVFFPRHDASYYEKCISIFSAFDSITKQYSSYCKNGKIDFDLLSISSHTEKYDEIPSLVENKYIYGSNILNNITDSIMSDQSMLAYVKRIYDQRKKYCNFAELISKEKITIDDYDDPEKDIIQLLRKYGVIDFSDDGTIIWKDQKKKIIIEDLYWNDVISRWHYPQEYQTIFDSWIENGLLTINNTLLSIPESNYFDYILNKSKYVNGYDLRNKYAHGIQQFNLDENNHRTNYIIFLCLIIIIAVKIEDDLNLANRKK